ncbi:MAG: hypothetical protein WCC73_13845, partial [Terracidiphilus sp.]
MQYRPEVSTILGSMRVFPLGPLTQSAALVLCANAVYAIPANAQAPSVTLTPAVVEAGSPELIRVAAPVNATLEGEWQGQKLEFFWSRDQQAWYALAGVDVESAVGTSSLQIKATLNGRSGGVTDLSRSIEIHEAHYRTGT